MVRPIMEAGSIRSRVLERGCKKMIGPEREAASLNMVMEAVQGQTEDGGERSSSRQENEIFPGAESCWLQTYSGFGPDWSNMGS